MATHDALPLALGPAADVSTVRRRYHHPNLALLAAELGEVEAQVQEVLALTAQGRRRLARDLGDQPDQALKGWCLAVRLLEESEQVTRSHPDRGAQLAELARHMALALQPQRYGADHLAELTALAWAHEGNAFRVMGQLTEAAPCFIAVEELLAVVNAGEPIMRVHTLWRLASYRRAQRQLTEAQATAATALALARQTEDGVLQGVLLLQQAALDSDLGRLTEAQAACREALALLPADTEPRLHAEARFNLAAYLARAGSFQAAAEELALAEPYLHYLSTNALVKVSSWLQGIICRGLGQGKAAITHLHQARAGFLRQRRPYQAALVTLELTTVYLEQGHSAAARALAIESYRVFKDLKIHREALAALVMVRDAADQNNLNVELLEQARKRAEE